MAIDSISMNTPGLDRALAFRDNRLPGSLQSGVVYTPELSDIEKVIRFTGSAAAVLTIAPDAPALDFPIGTVLTVSRDGAGAVTISTSPNWTKVGAGTGLINVSGNQIAGTTGSGRAAYLAPQQGNTVEQQVSYAQRIAATGAGPYAAVCALDEANWVGVKPGTGTQEVSVCVAGTRTTVGTLNNFASYNSGMRILAQRVGNTVQVYQRGVLLGAVDITNALPAAERSLGTATWKRSGIISNNQNVVFLDDWNSRVANSALTGKKGLRALTFTSTGTTTLTGLAAGSSASVPVSGIQGGSQFSVGSVSPALTGGASIIGDGQFVTYTGVPAGTYTVAGVETDPLAVNSPRTTNFTITLN